MGPFVRRSQWDTRRSGGAAALVASAARKREELYGEPFDFSNIKQALKDQVIFDGRNLYDPNFLKMQGLDYYGIGRGQSVASFGYSGPERRSR